LCAERNDSDDDGVALPLNGFCQGDPEKRSSPPPPPLKGSRNKRNENVFPSEIGGREKGKKVFRKRGPVSSEMLFISYLLDTRNVPLPH